MSEKKRRHVTTAQFTMVISMETDNVIIGTELFGQIEIFKA